MTEHPITPPLELIYQWVKEVCPEYGKGVHLIEEHVATKAAQWGADQELEACCALLDKFNDGFWCDELRAARRPKPPSLKEINLKHLEVMERDGHYLPEIISDLRRAIESLPS